MTPAFLVALLLQAAVPASGGALSAEGRAEAERMLAAQEVEAAALRGRMEAAGRTVQRVVATEPLDVDALRRAMADRDSIAMEQVLRRTDAAIALLERLSPADRAAVAKFVAAAPVPVQPAPVLPRAVPGR